MLRALIASACLAAASVAGAAQAETAPKRVETRDAFVQLVADRQLTRLGVKLTVRPDGQITGSAFGRPVRGAWDWRGGFFCRDLYYGDTALGPNCQVVEARGGNVRFIADQGTGAHADLRVR
jgi:hypothetical protein